MWKVFNSVWSVSRTLPSVCRSGCGTSFPILKQFLSTLSLSSSPSIIKLKPLETTVQQVRYGLRIFYRPNVSKRLRKHGLAKRLSTRRGCIVMWRKIIKGRHNLST